MRVCIVADSASVRFGGEAILPYHYFRMLSQRGVDAWLVVHDRTRPELEASLPEYRDRIVYSPDSPLHRFLSYLIDLWPRRLSESTLGLISFLVTQRHQREVIRDLVRRERIDVVHQPSPVSPRRPSLMYGLGAPVVIGPLNGGMNYPMAFRGQESAFSHAGVWAARGLSDLVNRLLPGKRRAATILVANQRTREALPSGLGGNVVELVENAVDLETWLAKPSSRSFEQIRSQFLFLGRLVDWKRLDIALYALAMVPQATLVVIGDGEMRENWERLARELKIDDRVSFLGWQPHERCAQFLSQSGALILPSVYECGGAVVLEAMASGRAVIATRWGGPADYLDENCGILVNPEGNAAMVARFAEAMVLLASHPETADRMGAAGQLRVQQHFSWRLKIDKIEKIYREAMGSSMIATQ
jgi:glycosyltransferase involved in cell wall biosynthesis